MLLRYVLCALLCWPVCATAQPFFPPQRPSAEKRLEELSHQQHQLIRFLEQPAPQSWSANEVLYLRQLSSQLAEGKVYFLHALLRRASFAEKLHTVLDTTRLLETARQLADIQQETRIWERVAQEKRPAQPHTFLAEAEVLSIQKGDRILEIGGGRGGFAWNLANQYPDATIWMSELDTFLLAPLSVQLQQKESPDNLRLLYAFPDRTGLPNRSVDKVIMRQVLHHLDQPSAVLEDIRHILDRGGQLFLLEGYDRQCNLCCSEIWSRQQIVTTLQEAGFTLVREQFIPQSTFFLTEWRPAPQ